MERTFVAGKIKDCCQDAANLELVADESRADLEVKRCRVCGCRHRKLTLDPGRMKIVAQTGR